MSLQKSLFSPACLLHRALCSCSTSGSQSGSARAKEEVAPEPRTVPLLHGSLGRGTAAPARSCALQRHVCVQEMTVGRSGNHLRELKCCRRCEGKVRSPWCADVQQQLCRNSGLVQPAGQKRQIQLLWAHYKGNYIGNKCVGQGLIEKKLTFIFLSLIQPWGNSLFALSHAGAQEPLRRFS